MHSRCIPALQQNHKAKISSDENRIETPPSVRKKLSSVTAVDKSITTIKLITLIIVGNNSYVLLPSTLWFSVAAMINTFGSDLYTSTNFIVYCTFHLDNPPHVVKHYFVGELLSDALVQYVVGATTLAIWWIFGSTIE